MLEQMFLGLTPAQEEAAKMIDSDLEIVACAGAGKTRTITLRIINLIAHGVKPENIVAITFTRKAAAEMKERIYKAGEKYLGNTIGFAGMFIGTIDSFCLKMLQEHIPKYAKFSVLDEVQTKVFMERYFRHDDKDPTGLYGSVIDQAINLKLDDKYAKKIDYYTALMSILNSCYHDTRYRTQWSEDLRDRFDRYNRCLEDHKYLDYSSLIRRMIEYLDPESDLNGGEMSDFASKIFEKVKYLIIDEYQDSNPPQEYLAELFHRYGHTNLCVVGDADQTIYQFRGSDESNILGFAQKYNAKKIVLNLDFRSTEAVVDIARKTIGVSHEGEGDYVVMERGALPGATLDEETGDTVYAAFENYDQEAEFIAGRIKKLKELGIPYSEMAVLFRKRRRYHFGNVLVDFQTRLAEKLQAAGIPYIVEGMNNLALTPEYQASKALFRFLYDNYYSKDHRGLTVEMLKNEWEKIGTKRHAEELLNGLSEAIDELTKTDWSALSFGHDFNMQEIFQDFIGHMAFVESDRPEAEEILYNLGKFSRVIADFETIFFKDQPVYKAYRFARHLAFVAGDLYPEGEEDNAYIREDAVRLMTIHQSKGLEFAAVFIPAMTAEIYSWGGFERKEYRIYGPIDALDAMAGGNAAHWIPNHEVYTSSQDSERKIVYVAFTRAKKYLFLTWGATYGYDDRGMEIPEEESSYLAEAKASAHLIPFSKD
ncbi:MAG: ATP-dependent helicase, partial [Lachnospiraceae bacterium]|nr:ATP-dependent helicase [Lachnospiraceae bacterium]